MSNKRGSCIVILIPEKNIIKQKALLDIKRDIT